MAIAGNRPTQIIYAAACRFNQRRENEKSTSVIDVCFNAVIIHHGSRNAKSGDLWRVFLCGYRLAWFQWFGIGKFQRVVWTNGRSLGTILPPQRSGLYGNDSHAFSLVRSAFLFET